ncbi:MAG: hypothetical protein AAF610_01960 [Pseudomonadota bacterium]
MTTPPRFRARQLAFAIGGAAVLIELLALVAVSHARAPTGQFLAGDAHYLVAPAPANPPVILFRPAERSL